MKTCIIAFYCIATFQTVTGELVSPNGQYEIEYVGALPHESNVRLKNVKSGKVLSGEFSNGYDHSSYLETAWSADSRYLAVVERGTRTTATLTVFLFSGDTVDKTRLPDYTLNLLGRKELVSGGRYHLVSKLRWEATTLTFYCTGQWVDGSGDPELEPSNWYHFDVTISFGSTGNASDPRLAKVTEYNKTKMENKPEMATPRKPSD